MKVETIIRRLWSDLQLYATYVGFNLWKHTYIVLNILVLVCVVFALPRVIFDLMKFGVFIFRLFIKVAN